MTDHERLADGQRRVEIRERAAEARHRARNLKGLVEERRDGVHHTGGTGDPLGRQGMTDQIKTLAEELAIARERITHLETALVTNRHIAMAVGIVMARRGLTEEQAFDALREASQRRHVKVREIAEEIVYTGQLPHPRTTG
jgi:hypothetical protein